VSFFPEVLIVQRFGGKGGDRFLGWENSGLFPLIARFDTARVQRPANKDTADDGCSSALKAVDPYKQKVPRRNLRAAR
jgi:hypothetical protein